MRRSLGIAADGCHEPIELRAVGALPRQHVGEFDGVLPFRDGITQAFCWRSGLRLSTDRSKPGCKGQQSAPRLHVSGQSVMVVGPRHHLSR